MHRCNGRTRLVADQPAWVEYDRHHRLMNLREMSPIGLGNIEQEESTEQGRRRCDSTHGTKVDYRISPDFGCGR